MFRVRFKVWERAVCSVHIFIFFFFLQTSCTDEKLRIYMAVWEVLVPNLHEEKETKHG